MTQVDFTGDGRATGRFDIPELHGHLLVQWLQRRTAPRRLSRDKLGQPVVDPTVGNHNVYELRGQAFCELLEHLPTQGPAGGYAANGVTMLITMDLQRLLDGLGSARLDTGVHISAGDARRLACNAGLVPVVLDGPSRPLDLGRTKRLHTDAQRKALAVLYDTCGIDGCQRPFAWCEIHHLDPWSNGGPTDLANALPAKEAGAEVSMAIAGVAADSLSSMIPGLMGGGTTQAMLDSQRQRLMGQIGKDVNNTLLYVYRDLSDGELDEFASFAESNDGKAYYKAALAAVRAGLAVGQTVK